MSDLATLVKASDWDGVVAATEDKWAQNEPTAQELFFRSLATFAQEDLFDAYSLALQSFELNGDSAEVSEYLAALCVMVGRVKDSYFYRKLLSVLDVDEAVSAIIPQGFIPDYTDLLSMVEEAPLLRKGNSAEMKFEWDEAEHWYQQHIAFEPHDKQGYMALVRCQLSQERTRAASETLKGARALFPEDESFASMLGEVLTSLGQFDGAEGCYKWAVDQAPFDEKVHARYIRGLLRDSRNGQERSVVEMKKWIEQHVQEIRGAMQPATLGERKTLRVGFIVTGMDRTRIAPAVGGVLSWFDQTKFQFIGYGEGILTHPYNRYFKTAFTEWRDIGDTDAMTLRNMIIADGVDILIDMVGVLSSETMRCFGSRLAPVQMLWAENSISGFLPEIDFVVADRCPKELEAKHITLPGSAIFSAVRDARQHEGTSEEGKDLTFVADATFAELTTDTVSLWAKVLLKNPGSMLLLRSHDFYAEDNSRYLIELFGIFGVAHRVDIIQESDRRDFFAHGDVGLLPTQGGAAEVVLDALSAGVPILGCSENDLLHYPAIDVLKALELDGDMVSETESDFVENATHWAHDKKRLSDFSHSIVETLSNSMFLNEQERMAQIEKMFWQVWERKCAQEV